uniref:Tc1-like transposase DDE domain-containing protein n=1 Tax=Oryzias latipes TaxID=8090 RepID=A0A3P9IJS3_ORYLA
MTLVNSGKYLMAHMVRPALTPDLNHIKHVWDQLKQGLVDVTPPERDPAELHAALVEEWKVLSTRRCQTVLSGNTHF